MDSTVEAAGLILVGHAAGRQFKQRRLMVGLGEAGTRHPQIWQKLPFWPADGSC